MKKKKILVLSDHALCTSGVGVQSRYLIEGLVEKGDWTVRQFGAAMQHTDYETVIVNDDFIIKPINGFGDRDLLRVAIATEKPDVILIFTDPRFFIWLWEMEDEIHQQCPVAYWHVWDNYPSPTYNKVLYESTDLINCHSYLTYNIVNEMFPEKTNFIPHALPESLFFPMPKNEKEQYRIQFLGPERKDHFVTLWVNRNARRKRPNDALESWKIFLDELENTHGHRNATLLMHTDPMDQEGPNLLSVCEFLDIRDNVVFSTDRVSFEQMNILHNITDCCMQISYAEGFGLSTLEAMQVGNPIIAVKTGGLTRQVVDHRDGSENGVALPVEFQSLVGSQTVPYIYEDYCSNQTIAKGIMKLYNMPSQERLSLGQKARDYVLSEFNQQKTIDMWHETLNDTIENWRDRHVLWDCTTL
tara:strand:- start:5035 stop:6279 length:1245 start_codon:yes stop_codon:yes gene_type:complete